MKKIEFKEFGDARVLQCIDAPIPKPETNQVLVKVEYSGLNPIDYKIRDGSSFMSQQLAAHLPSGLGYEMAGRVVALGPNVQHFDIDDEVCGFAGFLANPGCYSEYVVADADKIINKPTNVPSDVAACLPLAGLTALQSLELLGEVQNKTLLIHAASGGVGHIALQLAKLQGAKLIVTASDNNHDYLTKLGADVCIDYQTQDFTEHCHEVDGVIDLVGGETGIRSLSVLKTDGLLVTVPTVTRDQVIAVAKKQSANAIGMIMQPNIGQLVNLLVLVNSKKLNATISKYFELSEAVQAHECLEQGHGRGKLCFRLT